MQHDYAELINILHDLWSCGQQAIKQHNQRARLHVSSGQLVNELKRRADPKTEPLKPIKVKHDDGTEELIQVENDLGVTMFLQQSEQIEQWAFDYEDALTDFKSIDWRTIVGDEQGLFSAVAIVSARVALCTNSDRDGLYRQASQRCDIPYDEFAVIAKAQETCRLRLQSHPAESARRKLKMINLQLRHK